MQPPAQGRPVEQASQNPISNKWDEDRVLKEINWLGRKITIKVKHLKNTGIVLGLFLMVVGGAYLRQKGRQLSGAILTGVGLVSCDRFVDNWRRKSKADKIKEDCIKTVGSQEALDALPQVRWTRHPDYVFFFFTITPEDMWAPTMRMVERNGKTIALVKKDGSDLYISSFVPLPTELSYKLKKPAGWDNIYFRDGTIEGRRQPYHTAKLIP